ncbi:MAG: transcriptional regulator, partial [Oscillospiraceae bacterium]
MPNRIIKESICTSDTVDQLTWFEEVTFYRLIVNCDDYGRFDGRAAVIKSRLFPLKSVVTEKSVLDAIHKLSRVGLVTLYEFEGKPILQLTTWERHQQIRSKKSKYPALDETCNHLISDDIECPRNPIQSES